MGTSVAGQLMAFSGSGTFPVFTMGSLNPGLAVQVPRGWHPRIIATDLSPYWQRMPWMPVPRDIRGLSYTLLPAPVPPARFSAHFDPHSPFFQAEVVIRVVAPVEGEPVPMEMMSLLDPGDIGAWLRRFGDPSPLVEHVEFGRSEPVPGTRGRLRCFCQMRTHLDVGPDNPQSGVPDWVRVPTRREPGRRHWSEVVDGYAEQLRRVFSYMWYEGPFLVCCAVASTRYEDRRGCSVDTLARYPWLLRGQEEIAASVRVIDRGLGLRAL